jgi:hypothetical protein
VPPPAPPAYPRRIVPGILSSHTTWRLDVARRVAAVYAGNPKVAATAAVGSVGSGIADEWSDLELDIYWHAPPSDEDRRRPIDVLGGHVEQSWPYSERDEEWGEEYSRHRPSFPHRPTGI